MEKNKIIIAVVAVVVILIIAGVAIMGSSTVERSPDELVAAVGAHGGEPETGFDPILGWNYVAEPLIQSTLFKRDSEMNLVNDLATGYDVSGDGKTWTVNIRDDVKFHDNTSLTAKDVAFTYNKLKEVGVSEIDVSNMINATAINDTAVQFTLNQTDSTFLSKLCVVGIVPEASYNNDTYGENPVGSGPYKFVQWDKGQQVILELNENYYREKPYFKKITILYLDEDASFAAAKRGEVDIAEIPLSYSKESIDNMRMISLDSVDARGISLPAVPDTGNVGEEGEKIGNNVTSNEAIRKALNYGISRQELIDGPLNGNGNKSFDGIGSQLPWSNSEAEIQDGDIEEAKRILEADGWTDSDGDGIVEKDGLKASFTLLYPASDSTRQAIAVSVSEQAKKFGIEVVPEGKSWDEIYKLQYANAVEWGQGMLDPSLLSSLYQTGSENNVASYSNPTVDQHIETAKTTMDEDASYSSWSDVSWDGSTGISPKGDAAYLWTVFIDYAFFVDDTLDIGTPVIQPHGGDIFGNIYEWKRVNATE